MTKSGNIGMSKHRKSGHTPSSFTGRKSGKRKRRKGSTRKQRKAKLNSHKNRYEWRLIVDSITRIPESKDG